ncbi:hypothetical protein V4C53_46310 [Paraburkholderia azotifigens]|uniref:hypothetical protein n=1 Tax=Paraburkholderia azotifigens TaxID=2057004 RepID=UPI00316CF4C5
MWKEMLDAFGIRRMPWVMRVYLVLFLVCVGLMLYAVSQTPASPTADHPAVKLLSLATDSFKIVLGAVLGSLSMAAHKQFGETGHSDESKPGTAPQDNE